MRGIPTPRSPIRSGHWIVYASPPRALRSTGHTPLSREAGENSTLHTGLYARPPPHGHGPPPLTNVQIFAPRPDRSSPPGLSDRRACRSHARPIRAWGEIFGTYERAERPRPPVDPSSYFGAPLKTPTPRRPALFIAGAWPPWLDRPELERRAAAPSGRRFFLGRRARARRDRAAATSRSGSPWHRADRSRTGLVFLHAQYNAPPAG